MCIRDSITGDMQRAAAASIDRSIGKAEPQEETEPERKGIVDFQPYEGKKRKPGTGCEMCIRDRQHGIGQFVCDHGIVLSLFRCPVMDSASPALYLF